MAVFKCKMCGGSLEITDDQTIVTCDYCSTQQTLPKFDDEKKLALFNRANNLRFKNEFDKASGIYESIIAEFPDEAEAYWGLVLCKYGIEYVEDVNGCRIPTCHRTLPVAIMDDDDFQQACENADITAKNIYRKEAKSIDKIQKKILDIALNEEPYDIFICYKETDDITGSRTEDSLVAQDIYAQLLKDGYRVFFSRVTLREVAGSEYEPYIYAALSSSKIMLAIGTKHDYYDAVWVKNEWSRFISMMGDDSTKVLIPCFKNMDAYDMPKEFKNMQGLDMGDVTFFGSLIDNIKKVISKDVSKSVKETVVVNSNNSQPEPLLKRAYIFLEDGDWNSANQYCEKVLDIDPENPRAYLGKLMAELHVKKQDDLKKLAKPFDNNANYQKILRFSDEKLRSEIYGYIQFINKRNELQRVDGIYKSALSKFKTAKTEAVFKQLSTEFNSIGNYKDSPELEKECLEKAEKIRKEKEFKAAELKKLARARTNKIIKTIVCVLVVILAANAVGIPVCILVRNSVKYNGAVAFLENEDYVAAYEAFISLDSYKDSSERADSIYTEYIKAKLSSAQKGDEIYFGSYDFGSIPEIFINEHKAIDWIVLDKQDGRALVISKYAIAFEPYNETDTAVTWETCTLRKWLNDDFLNLAFSDVEKAMIPMVTVEAQADQSLGTDSGNNTQDKVFILSAEEAKKYFSTDEERICKPIDLDYCFSDKIINETETGNSSWYLRSQGNYQNKALVVYYGGSLSAFGDCVNEENGIRPAMWITYE